MNNTLIFNMTTFVDALDSLSKLLGVFPEELLKFIYLHDSDATVDDLLANFNLNEKDVFDTDLYLVSLHVTTNDDDCEAIKCYGLRNLQESIKLETTLSRFLKRIGISINLDDKILSYQNKIYDLSKQTKGFNLSDEEENCYLVGRKLFRDHQINGFFYSEDSLDYGGYVRARPEILHTIAQLIKYNDYEMNRKWQERTKCYVIKFKAHIDKYENYIFRENDYEEPDKFYKVRWVVKQCLGILINYSNGHSVSDVHSYTKFDTIVPYEDMEIFIADSED